MDTRGNSLYALHHESRLILKALLYLSSVHKVEYVYIGRLFEHLRETQSYFQYSNWEEFMPMILRLRGRMQIEATPEGSHLKVSKSGRRALKASNNQNRGGFKC